MVIRRVMKELGLKARRRKAMKHGSCKGEIAPPAPSLIARDFLSRKAKREVAGWHYGVLHARREGPPLFWSGVSLDEFMKAIGGCLVWLCGGRIKTALGNKTPMEHRQSLGLAA